MSNYKYVMGEELAYWLTDRTSLKSTWQEYRESYTHLGQEVLDYLIFNLKGLHGEIDEVPLSDGHTYGIKHYWSNTPFEELLKQIESLLDEQPD